VCVVGPLVVQWMSHAHTHPCTQAPFGSRLVGRTGLAFNAGLTAPDHPQEEWRVGVLVGVVP